MVTALYLNNNKITAAVGTKNRHGIWVRSLYETDAPEGSLVNGVVMDAEALSTCLQHFFSENKIPKKHVILVLNSTRLTHKMIRAPKCKPAEMLKYVNREFAAMQQKQDIAVGYFAEGEDALGILDLFAMRMEQSFIEGYDRIFRRLKIRLEAVQSGMGAFVAAAAHFDYLQEKTCIVQVMEENNLYSFLLSKGRYLYSSASRLFQEKATPGFGLEVARTVSGILQFAAAQKLEEQITDIYWAGFAAEEEEICREHILQMGAQLSVGTLTGGGWIHIAGRGGEEGLGVTVFAAAALGMPGADTDLYSNYLKNNKQAVRRRAARRAWMPAMLSLGAGAAALAGTVCWYLSVKEYHDELVSYNESAAMVQMLEQYRELTAKDSELRTALAELETAIQNLEGYPVFDQKINQMLKEDAAGLVWVDILGYRAQTGAVQLLVTAQEMNDIQLFVERLEGQKGLARVAYTGYTQSPQSSEWYGNIEVYLEASGEKTEG